MTGVEAGLLALVVLMMVGYVHVGMWGRGMFILAVLAIWTAFFVYGEVRFRDSV
ncbi:MAG: hypothetical protein QME78_15795 [Thermodesulfobacteriota bacterium]|nr:hypothetical protein [Thermodesulfobacteriota bacterium]